MIIYDGNLTNRQKYLITKIGRENREKIDAKIKRLTLVNLIYIIVSILFALVLYRIDELNAVSGTLIILALLGLLISTLSSRKQLNDLKMKDDYEIGLFYADKDKRVKGRADKKLRTLKVSAIVLGLIMLLCGGLIFGLSYFPERINFDQLTKVEGPFEDAKFFGGDDDRIEFKIKNDKTRYAIEGLYIRDFNWAEFEQIPIKEDLPLTLYCNGSDVYYVEFNGVEYLTFNEVKIRAEENRIGGMFTGGAFVLFGLISVVVYIVYRYRIYPSDKENEVIDLNYSDEELNEVVEEFNEYSAGTSYIKTGYLKLYLYIYLVFTIISIAMIIGSLFAIEIEGLFLTLFLLGLFFGVISIIGLIDLTKNFEVLDNDTLTVHRFFKKKEIKVKDIKSIDYRGTFVIFLDKNSKSLCRVDVNSTGLMRLSRAK